MFGKEIVHLVIILSYNYLIWCRYGNYSKYKFVFTVDVDEQMLSSRCSLENFPSEIVQFHAFNFPLNRT